MIRNRQRHVSTFLDHDYVTSVLTGNLPAEALKCPNDLPGSK
jgi:thiaminase